MLKKVLLTVVTFIAIVLMSNQVNAMTIVLDPGHGGNGAGESKGASNGELLEKDINLKIGLYLREYLNQYKDVNVIMTRSDDSELTVYRRAMIARANKADLLVSLHTNDSANQEGKGVEVWVTRENCLPKYNEETSKLAGKIVSNITDLGISNRGVKVCNPRSDVAEVYSTGTAADYYGIICFAMRGTKMDSDSNYPNNVRIYIVDENGNEIDVDSSYCAKVEEGEGVPTVLVEHAFIKTDVEFLDSDEDLKKLAEADGKAIVEQYGLKLKNEEIEKPDAETKPLDIYEDLYKNFLNTPAMAYKLQNVDDRLTGKDIITAYPKATIKLNNKEIKETDIICNGDKIEKDGKEYTTIVYGDTNNDGKINILDAVAVLNHVKQKTSLEGAKFVAADLNCNGSLNILEAVKILNVVKEKITYNAITE